MPHVDMGELFFIALLAFCGWLLVAQGKQSAARRASLNPTFEVALGQYVDGLPGIIKADSVTGFGTDTEFVFVDTSQGRWSELARIPRESLLTASLDRQIEVRSRITATRLAAVGVFAVAMPKREERQQLGVVVEWLGIAGSVKSAAFRFSGIGAETLTRAAVGKLTSYIVSSSRSHRGTPETSSTETSSTDGGGSGGSPARPAPDDGSPRRLV